MQIMSNEPTRAPPSDAYVARARQHATTATTVTVADDAAPQASRRRSPAAAWFVFAGAALFFVAAELPRYRYIPVGSGDDSTDPTAAVSAPPPPPHNEANQVAVAEEPAEEPAEAPAEEPPALETAPAALRREESAARVDGACAPGCDAAGPQGCERVECAGCKPCRARGPCADDGRLLCRLSGKVSRTACLIPSCRRQ